MGGEKSVEVWGTGSPRREFLYVDDLADAIVHLIGLDDPPDWVNVGTGVDQTILELAHLVAKTVGYQGRIATDPTRPDGYQEFQPTMGVTEENLVDGYLPLKVGFDSNQFKLQGIIVAPSGNSAMLNGQRVRVNDHVFDVTVVEIEPGYIVLEGNGDHLKLELFSLSVKKSAQRKAGDTK